MDLEYDKNAAILNRGVLPFVCAILFQNDSLEAVCVRRFLDGDSNTR